MGNQGLSPHSYCRDGCPGTDRGCRDLEETEPDRWPQGPRWAPEAFVPARFAGYLENARRVCRWEGCRRRVMAMLGAMCADLQRVEGPRGELLARLPHPVDSVTCGIGVGCARDPTALVSLAI